jgi:hypothetical protein
LMMMIIIVAIIKYRLDEGCRHPPTQTAMVMTACHSDSSSNRHYSCHKSDRCYRPLP